MAAYWTIGRATGAGAIAGLLVVLLWPIAYLYPETLSWPLLAIASLAGLCGLSILLMTVLDLLFHRRRGPRVRPLRMFDVAFGAALVGLWLLVADALGQI